MESRLAPWLDCSMFVSTGSPEPETQTTVLPDQPAGRDCNELRDEALWKYLFQGYALDQQRDLLPDTVAWCERRVHQGDVAAVDPGLAGNLASVMEAKCACETVGEKVKANQVSRDQLSGPLETTTRQFLDKRVKALLDGGYQGVPEEHQEFVSSKKALAQWVAQKMEVFDKAHMCLLDEQEATKDVLFNAYNAMIEKAEKLLHYHRKNTTPVETPTVDDAVMEELDTMLQSCTLEDKARLE